MEKKEITEEMKKLINKPLPAEALSQHPTKTYLTSIKAIYVTERLNEVFGIGAWRIKTEQIGEVGEKGMVVVKVIFEVPEYGIYYESFGGNDNGGENSKNFDLGDAYKGATTDAITKIASYIGIGIEVFKGKAKVGKNNTPNKNNDDKPWYNDFDKHQDFYIKQIKEGKTADEIIKKLTDKYKVNNAVRQSIKDLEADYKES